jgi:hypothetical protein
MLPGPRSRLLVGFIPATAVALVTAAAAQTGLVQRCESKDGRVTYSNTACPEGTLPVRKVNTDPPVSVDAKKTAEERAMKDGAALKQLEKERAQQEARERKQAEDRAKADARAKERCERAKRDLERAKATRADLNARAAPVEKLQKADRETGRREEEVARECAR